MKSLHIYIIRCTLLVAMLFTVSWTRTWAAEAMAYVVLSSDYASLTFYFDENQNSHSEGTVILVDEMLQTQQLMMNRGSITMVTIDASFANYGPTSTASWFNSMSQLRTLDLSNLTMTNVTNTDEMFSGCSSLTTITVNDTWPAQNGAEGTVTPGGSGSSVSGSNMFNGCTSLVGGAGTPYDASHVDYTYAHIDGGDSNPGYFTGVSGNTDLEIFSVDKTVTYEPNKPITATPSIIMTPGNDTEWMTDLAIGLTNTETGESTDSLRFNASLYYPSSTETFSFLDAMRGTLNPKDGEITTNDTTGETTNSGNAYIPGYKNLPKSGAYMTFEALQGGSLLVPIRVTSDKALFVVDSDGNALTDIQFKDAAGNSAAFLTDPLCAVSPEYASGFVSFNVEAGKKYYVFCNASKPRFAGYIFSKETITIDTECMKDVRDILQPAPVRDLELFAVDATTKVTPNVAVTATRSVKMTPGNDAEWNPRLLESSSVSLSFNASNYYASSTSTYTFWGALKGANPAKDGELTEGQSTGVDYDYKSKNLPNSGAYITYEATQDGSLIIPMHVPLNKPLYVVDSNGKVNTDIQFINAANQAEVMLAEPLCVFSETEAVSGFLSFNVKQGEKYTIFINGGVDLRYGGYVFSTEAISINPATMERVKGILEGTLSEPYAILENNVLTFYYDDQKQAKNGMSVGPFTQGSDREWNDKSAEITKVVFDESFANETTITSTGYWFSGFTQLASIEGLNYLNTSNVEDMWAMFENCKALNTVDLIHFDTRNVKTMGFMFSGCENLQNLDVSSFNTANVTHTNAMFANCFSLTSLDLSGFNTKKVENMYDMFLNCTHLTTIYAGSEWSTEVSTGGINMFAGCTSLVGGAGTVYDANHIDHTYAHIDGGEGNPGYFTAKSAVSVTATFPFSEGTEGQNAVFSHADYFLSSQVTHGSNLSIDGNRTCAGTQETLFTPVERHDDNLTDDDAVTFLISTKSGFTFTPTKVSFKANRFGTDMGMMDVYWQCPDGTTIELEKGLRPDRDNAEVNTVKSYDITGDVSGEGECGLKLFLYNLSTTKHIGLADIIIEGTLSGEGVVAAEPYAALSENNTVLTFYYDDKKEQMNGMDVGPFEYYSLDKRGWSPYASQITKAVFDPSFDRCTSLTSTAYWFIYMTQLETIEHIEYLHTDNVEDMNGMFDSCYVLRDLDVSHFVTAKVKNMNCMFNRCESLTSLDLGNFDTSSCTILRGMFYDCKGLTRLDLTNFDTSKNTSTESMFELCSSLESITFGSGFSTENVTSMYAMFDGCSALKSLDLTGFSTTNVTDMGYMFTNCSGLTNLNVNGFNTNNVTNMYAMFFGCENLSELDISNFNTANVTDMSFMFGDCMNLTKITWGSYFNTEKVTSMRAMFQRCWSMPSIDVSGFNTSNVTSMEIMFTRCYAVTSLNLSNFNTEKVTTMHGMFYMCDQLSNLNTSSFNTSNVTDMGEMFLACTSLASLDVSGFNTQQVTNMQDMFRACTNLTSLDLSRFNTQNVTEMYGMFYDCTNLKSLDLSNFDTRNVRNMDHLFRFCKNLVNLNISGFSTANGASQRNMFEGCSSLASIQAGNAVIADSTYAQIENPNLLLYVNEASQTPQSVRNVVVLDEAEQIVLTDTVGNNNFYCPRQFRAKRISYTHNYKQATQVGVSRGWETIALPFSVQTITHEKNGTLVPFGVDGGKPFWLRELTENGLVSAQRIEAYVPYLISMPNNSIYPDDYNQAGNVTFSATDAVVPVTEIRETSGNNRTLIPTMMSVAQSPDIYVINRDTTYQNNPEGSIFVADYREVRPFEAYVKHVGGGARYFALSDIPQLDVTGIESIEVQQWKGEQWWTLDGRKLNGRPSKKGIYIRNGKKVVVDATF